MTSSSASDCLPDSSGNGRLGIMDVLQGRPSLTEPRAFHKLSTLHLPLTQNTHAALVVFETERVPPIQHTYGRRAHIVLRHSWWV